METQDKKQKRLVVDLNKDLHVIIKSKAAFRNITIKKWILIAIAERIKQESKYE